MPNNLAHAPAPHLACKTATADLVAVRIHADLCPQVHMRIFGVLAQLGIEPLTMTFARTDAEVVLDCAFAAPLPDRLELLVHKLRAIVSVRDAIAIADLNLLDQCTHD